MKNHHFILILLGIILVITAFKTSSETALQPMSIPSTESGFPVQLSQSYIYEAAVTLADLEDDGKQEIILGGRTLDDNSPTGYGCHGIIYVYNADGSLRWEELVRADVNSSPAAADLNNDGVKDIVVGMGAWQAGEWGKTAENRDNECGQGHSILPGNGGVVALNGKDGTELWTFNTQDWGEWGEIGPDGTPSNGVLDGVWSSPAIADIDRDGDFEIGFSSWDNCIYLLDHRGNPLWGEVPIDTPLDFCGQHGFFSHDTVWSSPAFADLTGDGRDEMIVGGDVTCDDINNPDQCNRYGLPTGGVLWVIDTATGDYLAQRWSEQSFYSSPAVADLEGDGVLDVVIGTGQGFESNAQYPTRGYFVSAWNLDLTDPNPQTALVQKWKYTTKGRVFSSPAIGDLNNDGILDVAIISKVNDWGFVPGELPTAAPNKGSYVYGIDGQTGTGLWATRLCTGGYAGQSFPTNTSPVLADVAGDDRPEVIYPHGWSVNIMNPDGTYYTDVFIGTTSLYPYQCYDRASTTSHSLHTGGTLQAPVAVGDLDGDGDAEIVAGGHWNEEIQYYYQGGLYVWSGFKNGDKPWPMFHQNAQHTGLYPLAATLSVEPASIYLMHDYQNRNDAEIEIHISNEGGESFEWEGWTDDPGISLATARGSVPAYGTVSVTAYVATTGYISGTTYNVGNITIAGMQGNDQVANSPATIPVQLYIGDLKENYIPFILK